MVKIALIVFGVLITISLFEVLVANWFIKKIIVSKNAKEERMKKLHRINLDKYIPIIKKKRNILMSHIYEIVKIKSDDNLNLKGILFKREGSKKIVICFHEYTSKGLTDFTAISNFYLDMCNVIDEVKKSKLPILFIHGEKDNIVPCSMCYDLYNNCNSPKDILIVKEAGHEESYYKDSKSYEEKVKDFIIKYV